MIPRNFIEVHGAGTGKPWLCAVSDINAVIPIDSLPPSARAKHGADTRSIVNTFSGNHFTARETYDQVKSLLEAAQAEPSELVAGHSAEFWQESYHLLRDAVAVNLDPFIREDDVAEEAIFVDAIERTAAALRMWPAFQQYLADGGSEKLGTFHEWADKL